MNQKKSRFENVDHKLMWPSIIFVLAVMILAALFPEKLNALTAKGAGFITHQLGFIIQIVALGCVGVLAWLAFGKYSTVRFGGKDAKPEFSFVSFAFMMFTAGVGAGLVYWAIGEPIYYMQWPPYGYEPMSAEASTWSIAYSIYHWNIIGWSIFLLPAIPYAYYLHNRRKTNLRLSALCTEVIGEKHESSWLGYLINIFAIFGTLGAFSTSMGVSADLLSAGLNKLFHIQPTVGVKVAIVASFIIFYAIIMLLGLKKGISKLANICVYISVGMITFILMAGPTSFIINYTSDSVGMVLNNFFRMSFYTDPVMKSGFPQDWTIFYWAWYFAYLVMMGLFIAKVSYGRKIKEVVLTCVIGSSLGCMLFLGILGGYTVNGILTNTLPIIEWFTNLGLAGAIIEVIASVPLGSIVLVIFLIAAYFLITTTMTSATYAVSMMTTKNLKPNEDPDLAVRLIWCVAVGAISMVALLMGGAINTIKSMAIISAPPMIVLYIIMFICLLKWLKKDYRIKERLEELSSDDN
ncbi:MAG: BCCT family transporter [Maledivibacter sp.]|jgi:choline/carnitine/betaine transport|nr:BCCT family transporter [Maledivibacter sp.]